jgi:sugar/nucleoside kinase (ribokinase family)
MKVLVLGHLAIDVDHRSDTETTESPGGVYRSAAALAELMGREATIIPVCGVNRAEHRAMMEHFGSLPGVETAGIYPTDAPTHRVHFYHGADGAAVACAREIGPPIPFERIRKFLDAGSVLINMSSGSDLSLDTLDEIRMIARARAMPIHLDLHNLPRGVNERFERVLRPLPEWRRWTFWVDTVQGTEEEMGILRQEMKSEEELVGHIFTLMVKRVLITRGAGGATIYRNDRKRTFRDDLPPGAPAAGNPAGAGDMFAAAFMASLLRSGDEIEAARAAVAAAAGFAGRQA